MNNLTARGQGSRWWSQSILQARARVASCGGADQKGPHELQQNRNILEIIPNIPEVLTDIAAHHRPHGDTPTARSSPSGRDTHTQITLCGAVQAGSGSDRDFCVT
jgi:hypothetical protein